MTERTIYLPKPFPLQQEILSDPSTYKVCCCGRQWGKTILGSVACVYGHGPIDSFGIPKFKGAVFGMTIWWVTKDYPTARKIWRDLKKYLARWGGKLEINETDWRIDFPGGGAIEVKSAATSVRKDSGGLRGDTIDGLVLDEAAYCPESTWEAECEPMLMARSGWVIFISSPNGQNWFFDKWELGSPKNRQKDPEWNSWQIPTHANPAMPRDRLARIEARCDKYRWAREYLAQFDVEGGVIFERRWFRTYKATSKEIEGRRVAGFQAYTDASPPEEFGPFAAREGMYVFMTADFAMTARSSSDYTAIAVWGVSPDGRLWLLDMVRDRIEWHLVIPKVYALYVQYAARELVVEASGPLVRMNAEAVGQGMNVLEWKIHEGPLNEPRDKVARNGPAAPHVQAGRVLFPYDLPLLNTFVSECAAFPGGKGQHDDMVDCLGVAVWHWLLLISGDDRAGAETAIPYKFGPGGFRGIRTRY